MTAAALMPFAFEDHLVRVVMHEGAPWFVGKDVCGALGLKGDAGQHLRRLDDDEWETATICSNPLTNDQHQRINDQGQSGRGGLRQFTIISEPGVYRLTFTSRKPEAERFTRWLAHEVLPTLRKTGSYTFPADDQPSDEGFEALPSDGLQLGTPAYGHALASVSEVRRMYGREAARDLWVRLGLPYDESYSSPSAATARPDDTVARFLREALEQDARAPRLAAAHLYRLYVTFCQHNGLMPESNTYFGKLLVRMGVRRRSSCGVRFYTGLRLKEGLYEA